MEAKLCMYSGSSGSPSSGSGFIEVTLKELEGSVPTFVSADVPLCLTRAGPGAGTGDDTGDVQQQPWSLATVPVSQ